MSNHIPTAALTTAVGRDVPTAKPRVWLTILGSLVAALAMAASGLAAPVTLYDSLVGFDADGFSGASSTGWLANQFLTDNDVYKIDNVVINLAGTPSAAAANVRLDLYSDSASVPGSLLGTLTTPGSLAAGDNTFLGSGVGALAANTTYWLVLRVAGSGSLDWNYTFGAPSGPGASDITSYSNNGGAGWFPPTPGAPYMMTVNVAPVPEPSTYAMGLAGASALVGPTVMRRIRRRLGPASADPIA